MAFKRAMLSDGERIEYDELMDRACFESGAPVKTSHLGERLRSELEQAEQSGCEWVTWMLNDATERGLKSAGKAWQNQQAFHETTSGEQVIVKRSDVIRTRTIDLDSGRVEWQSSYWRSASVGELQQEIAAANVRIATEKDRVRDLIALLSLCLKHEVATVSEALEREGAELSEFLIANAEAVSA